MCKNTSLRRKRHIVKYYFSARYSLSDQQSLTRYKQIVAHLAKRGHINSNYVHMDPSSTQYKQTLRQISQKNVAVLDVQQQHLLASDALICDITTPSTTVGFQISTAISHKIPCLVIRFTDKNDEENTLEPVILTQQHLGLLKYVKLNDVSEIDLIIDDFVSEFVQRPYKFNFFLPLSTHNAIARKARDLGVTKSELIRKIIDDYVDTKKELQ